MKPPPVANGQTGTMSPHLKSILTALTIAALVVTFSVRVIAPNMPPMIGRADSDETKTFARANPGTLRLDNTDGMVVIHTHEGDTINGEARILAYRRGETTLAGLKEYASELVQITEEPGKLIVVTEPKARQIDYDLLVLYDISVPIGTNLDINSSNGNVRIEAGSGTVRVLGRNSDIDIQKPLGPVTAESINGRILVLDAPEGGTIRTVNGNVYAQVNGGSLQAATDNGVIHANLTSNGQENALEHASLTSQNGGVTLYMAKDISASITAHATRGNITSDLRIDTTNGANHRRFLQGTIGSGHATINLDTLNGNIVIARSN